MPLDHFKTQVLLLHSEQSALDKLSSGFGDRYTVHCATSGTEALNTLGETPINVIISAQNLPGMSGVEALREAKKRSPETIGILLTGDSETDAQALVGEKEVFQVVRGDVTGDSLKKLVDGATQQMRLMALAESANDTAARPDEPAAEHIIMETSENGATIISDGTGRLPALNPSKVSAAAAVGARAVDVLVLTKDQEFLTTIKESAHGMHKVHYANTLKQADETIREHKIGVAVVDAALVGEKIEQLTQHLRKGSPRLVSIVAGRRDDGEMLMDLINRGKVYRFLLKPVSPGRARLAVEASVKHHLEAPDAAFKTKGAAPSAPAKSAPKPDAKAASKPAPAPRAAPAPKPAAPPPQARKPAPKSAPADPPLGDPKDVSPIDDGLGTAFGDDTRFTETVTGLIGNVGKKLKGDAPQAEAGEAADSLLDLEASSSSGGTGGSAFANPKVLGMAAAAIAVLAAGAFWFLGGSGDPEAVVDEPVATSTPSITEGDSDFGAESAAGANVDALVDEARLARDAGQVFNPPGSNAIELYLEAVAADPSNAILAAELDSMIEQALGMAETALLETRLDDADAALQRVAMADPDNSRLVFLGAQLRQMQLRGHLADARAAIRDKRFEDTANALAAARALGLSDTAEVDAVAEEFAAARSEQRVDETLALATARLEEGNLLSPANDNARYYYDLVLSNDSANTAARQGLNVVASRLVLQARSEIDAGNLDAAEDTLADARAIDASNAELTSTEAALAAARDAIAARERRAAEARRQEEAARRAAAERAEEERRAAAEAEAERKAQQAAAAASQQQAAEEETTAEPVADAPAEEAPAAEPAESIVANEPAAALAQADVRDQPPIGISSLNRIRYVPPKYPRAAQRRGESGWVDIVFTVTFDGTVKDIEVRDSEPGDLFDAAATRAVEKWEFEPVVEDGVNVEKRAGVRMMFALE